MSYFVWRQSCSRKVNFSVFVFRILKCNILSSWRCSGCATCFSTIGGVKCSYILKCCCFLCLFLNINPLIWEIRLLKAIFCPDSLCRNITVIWETLFFISKSSKSQTMSVFSSVRQNQDKYIINYMYINQKWGQFQVFSVYFCQQLEHVLWIHIYYIVIHYV